MMVKDAVGYIIAQCLGAILEAAVLYLIAVGQLNPARSLGPALFSGGKALAQLWLFIVAPVIGAVVSALVWILGFDKE